MIVEQATAAVDAARDELAKAKEREAKALGWKKINGAPKDGTRVHLWMQIYASARSMGWDDSFVIPDAWFDGQSWVHMFRGKPAALESDYITHWQLASNALPSGMDIWQG